MDRAYADEKCFTFDDSLPQDWNRYPGLPEKPLVDYCTNEWKTNPDYRATTHSTELAFDGYEDETFCEFLCAIFRSRKLRRWFLVFNALVVFALYVYFSIMPKMAESRQLTDSLLMREQIASGELFGGLFGNNARVKFPDMIHLKTLDKKYLPGAHSSKHTGRLIFVGDIHGCKEELHALLKKIKFDHNTDHLITTGDMIVKGPDSLGTVDLLMKIGASCVRGNHEDRILSRVQDLNSTLLRLNEDSSQSSMEKTASALSKWPDESLSSDLSHRQIAYLQSCPVILKVGSVPALGGEVVVVHAGLVPNIPLEDQDPSSVMTMRTIDLHSHVPSPIGREGPANDGNRKPKRPLKKWPYNVFWARLWGRWMDILPKEGKRHDKRTTVVYGHDSKRGLQLKKWSKGLDSACVSGGKLTALIVSDNGAKYHVKQVKCKDYSPQKTSKNEEILQEAYSEEGKEKGVGDGMIG